MRTMNIVLAVGPTSQSPRQVHNILSREGRDLLWLFPVLLCSFPPCSWRSVEEKPPYKVQHVQRDEVIVAFFIWPMSNRNTGISAPITLSQNKALMFLLSLRHTEVPAFAILLRTLCKKTTNYNQGAHNHSLTHMHTQCMCSQTHSATLSFHQVWDIPAARCLSFPLRSTHSGLVNVLKFHIGFSYLH